MFLVPKCRNMQPDLIAHDTNPPVPEDAARKAANRAAAEVAKVRKDWKKLRKAERDRVKLQLGRHHQGSEESDDDDDDNDEEEAADWAELDGEDEVPPLSAMGPFAFHVPG